MHCGVDFIYSDVSIGPLPINILQTGIPGGKIWRMCTQLAEPGGRGGGGGAVVPSLCHMYHSSPLSSRSLAQFTVQQLQAGL